MNRRLTTIALVLASAPLAALADDAPQLDAPRLDAARATAEFRTVLQPVLAKACAECHAGDDPEADFRVDDLGSLATDPENVERWERILEMVGIGDMPPKESAPLPRVQRTKFVNVLRQQLAALGRGPTDYEWQLPKFGNRVNHGELFSGRHRGPAYTEARVWRMNAHIYSQLVQDLELGRDFVPPLSAVQGEGFDDYSLLFADEATIRTMLQNAKRVARTMVHGRLIKPRGAGDRDPNARGRRTTSRHRPLVEFAALEDAPGRERMESVAAYAFQTLLKREPTDDELKRYVDENLLPNVRVGGVDAGLRQFLVSVLLSPEFLFRMEMGLGERLPDGRRRLSPSELAFALSYALHDHPVKSVLAAAKDGRLKTRKDVERVARALLDDPKLLRGRMAVGSRDRVWQASKPYEIPAKPRLLRFFREYFDYARAPEVFKDDVRHAGVHDPRKIVRDADWLVLHALADDRDLLARLLTTDEYAVDYFQPKRDKSTRLGYAAVYNLPDPSWPSKTLLAMPEGQRAGMLTHPAWLVAHSGNFETDPVRRGKWIREHLLGGVVPDLPINVQAQLPEEPHHTIRQRFRVVRDEACWRCHRKMNPLGNPFEAYDDFGLFRERHLVKENGHLVASQLELNRRQRDAASPKIPVDTSGVLDGTGDPDLDGPVDDARDLVRRLARSDRVRQVFLRHVFRYWMGRNETLRDSPTLMAMDRAYTSSDGSFKETLVALFTSDSFLYRK